MRESQSGTFWNRLKNIAKSDNSFTVIPGGTNGNLRVRYDDGSVSTVPIPRNLYDMPNIR